VGLSNESIVLRRGVLLAAVCGVLTSVAGWAAETPLRLATFQADVTPPLGSPLCHGNVKRAEEISDPLTARGIILLGGQAPIVLCAVDWVRISNGGYDAWVESLARAVGTSTDRVSVHVLHQHDTPGIDFSVEELLATHGLSGRMFDPVAARQAIERTALAAAEALKRPHRVTHVGCGLGKVEKVASSRRILGPNGKCVMTRMSSCRKLQAVAAPEGTIDPYLRLLSFWDGDRPLAAIHYYACHPQSYYGKGGVSADFVGIARAGREKALPGVAQIYFNGAGGSVACGKYNDGSPENRPVLAARLEAGMKAAWDATTKTPVTAADVAWDTRLVQLPMRKNLDEAQSLRDLEDTSLSVQKRVYAARFVTWIRRVASQQPIQLSCLRIGPACVLHMPGELMVDYQLAAQAMRPDAFVCLAAYGEGGPGYICTKTAYGQGGYETSWVSMVAPEVEDVLMPAMRQLLGSDTPAIAPGGQAP